MKNKGFTLIELIIVIVIIAIISAVAIPRFTGYRADSSEEVCNDNRKSILRAYLMQEAAGEQVNMDEIIKNEGNKYFNDIAACPDEGEYTFTGNDVDGYTLSCSIHGDIHVNITMNDDGTISYSFLEDGNITSISDLFAVAEGNGSDNWKITESGLVSNSNGEELLYFDNEYDSYSIETTASLKTNEEGYGIIFETSVDDSNNDGNIQNKEDSGYIFQFDPGYTSGDDGRLIFRQRVTTGWNGESGVMSDANGNQIAINPSDIEGLNYTSDFWTDSHDVRIDVAKDTTDSTKKQVDVYVDNVLVTGDYDIQIDALAEGEQSKAGFRSWGDVEATIEDLNITPLSN